MDPIAAGDDSATPKPPENPAAERPSKRKMKSPYQLEVLEKTYAAETYPSEALRAELSQKIGLTDRQLQMWFCHRRLKDRKCPVPGKRARMDEDSPPPPPLPALPALPAPPVHDAMASPMGSSSGGYEARRGVGRVAVPRIRGDVGQVSVKHYYDAPPMMLAQPMAPQLSATELRVIASVEQQLREPLREDGPILGVEFEPLPPGAFGAPIVTGQQKQPVRPYDDKLYERQGTKMFKASTLLPSMEPSFLPSSSSGKRKNAAGGSLVVHPPMGSRSLHEYQFLPSLPSIQSESYERGPRFYDSPVVAPNVRVSSLPSSGPYLHDNEKVAPAYTFQSQMPSAKVMPQQGRQQTFASGPMEYDSAPQSSSFTDTVTHAQTGIPRMIGSEAPYLSSDGRMLDDDDTSQIDRKRKGDEARIAKEFEVSEKRMRKDLEKQDTMRKKREEQMRKEMEKHDRERRKEEERLLRERQREEERYHREKRRELERREKFLQKESLRAEKLRQKEEMRREKEAAKLKAANEKATARRIAKESLELIEDERLELMELAAASKGLSSIISLDSDTVENLELFRDMLSTFPPKSVQLKRPFALQPWTTSEENIGNLLMVWKFLVTFADVLGPLWAVNLDEFVQSLYDYDSKLLGEIHVTLLKTIIKDIEDVARTPATALGANQSSAANPGGGHPHIVEGAYAWGFDIRSWQRHLSPLTWPEILRQFALSAGFGPPLKKRDVEHTYFRDNNQGNVGEDVISTLRNGAAAENAVAWMQERGYSHRRRSRHRLTPGTVKFAAFHILSLEGSKGLTILEVADKIQKSRLRDLSTSKTPEASIAAALSRDTKLFERTAPSTYCVRSPFRKDPADADAILTAARDKIQIFASGLSDSDEAEKDVEDVEDAERDEDSEGDVADDPEVDDASAKLKLAKSIPNSTESKDAGPSNLLDNIKMDALYDKVGSTVQNGLNTEKRFPVPPGNSKVMNIPGAPQSLDTSSKQEACNADPEDEIDESNFGEPWVQGLTDGEYIDLSVEERLNALVSLIGVAIEGNSIRMVLEERLEAATALKKKLWAEAQLDKRRFKEDYSGKLQYSSLNGFKSEMAQTTAVTEGGSQTPQHIVNNRCSDGNVNPASEDLFHDPNCHSNIHTAPFVERKLLGQEFVANTEGDLLQQSAHAAEKSRSQLKSYVGYKAEEVYQYRSLPLGQDRRRNRYWLFAESTSRDDPGSGRIFFESRDGFWRLIDSEEAFDELLAALDTRGVRESHLHSMLQRIETSFKETTRSRKISNSSVNLAGSLVKTGVTETTARPDCSRGYDSPSSTLCGLTPDTVGYSSAFKIELGRNQMERSTITKRYTGFEKWMWKECYSPILCAMKYGTKRCPELLQTCNLCYQSYFSEEKHCPSCHKTFRSFHAISANFEEHVSQCQEKRRADPSWKSHVSDSSISIGICLIKAQLSLIEATLPVDALQSFWTEGYRKTWGVKLLSSSSAEELLQVLSLLEGAIKRESLSSDFETTSELLSSISGSGAGDLSAISGSVPVLPWIPDTTAALALRLRDLDSSISYTKVEPHKEKEAGLIMKLPSRYTFVKNVQELEPADTLDQLDYQMERKWLDPGSGRRGRGRGSRGGGLGRGRGRGRGGRGRGRGSRSSTRAEITDAFGNAIDYEKATRKYTRRGRARGRGRMRGRRTLRPRQVQDYRLDAERIPQFGGFNDIGSSVRQDSSESSPRSLGANRWRIEKTGTPYIEDDYNNAGFQSDEIGQASEDESDDDPVDYARDFGRGKTIGMIDDDYEDDEDEEMEDDEIPSRHVVDTDVDEYEEEDMGDDDEDDMEVGGERNEDEDQGASYSSEYSD